MSNESTTLMKAIVILLCGAPGSGKSTLASLIEQHSNVFNFSSVSRLSFDEHAPRIEWNDSSFSIMRQECLNQLQLMINQLYAHYEEASSESIAIILVDDIMYLRSMRRQVYAIARDSHLPLLTVHVKCHLSLALQRNAARYTRQMDSDDVIINGKTINDSEYVEENTIKKIYDTFEVPNDSDIFDRNNFTIDTSSSSDLIDKIHEMFGKASRIIDEFAKERRDVTKHQEEVLRSREACAASLHSSSKQADVMLRNIISQVMKQISNTSEFLTKEQRHRLGIIMAQAKAEVLRMEQLHLSQCGDSFYFSVMDAMERCELIDAESNMIRNDIKKLLLHAIKCESEKTS